VNNSSQATDDFTIPPNARIVQMIPDRDRDLPNGPCELILAEGPCKVDIMEPCGLMRIGVQLRQGVNAVPVRRFIDGSDRYVVRAIYQGEATA
jgi:hypothetical protein